jgi:hypothetical protein
MVFKQLSQLQAPRKLSLRWRHTDRKGAWETSGRGASLDRGSHRVTVTCMRIACWKSPTWDRHSPALALMEPVTGQDALRRTLIRREAKAGGWQQLRAGVSQGCPWSHFIYYVGSLSPIACVFLTRASGISKPSLLAPTKVAAHSGDGEQAGVLSRGDIIRQRPRAIPKS